MEKVKSAKIFSAGAARTRRAVALDPLRGPRAARSASQDSLDRPWPTPPYTIIPVRSQVVAAVPGKPSGEIGFARENINARLTNSEVVLPDQTLQLKRWRAWSSSFLDPPENLYEL